MTKAKKIVGYVVREGTKHGKGRYMGLDADLPDWKVASRDAYRWPVAYHKLAKKAVKLWGGRIVPLVENEHFKDRAYELLKVIGDVRAALKTPDEADLLEHAIKMRVDAEFGQGCISKAAKSAQKGTK